MMINDASAGFAAKPVSPPILPRPLTTPSVSGPTRDMGIPFEKPAASLPASKSVSSLWRSAKRTVQRKMGATPTQALMVASTGVLAAGCNETATAVAIGVGIGIAVGAVTGFAGTLALLRKHSNNIFLSPMALTMLRQRSEPLSREKAQWAAAVLMDSDDKKAAKGLDLSFIDFRKMDLKGANFKNARFHGALINNQNFAEIFKTAPHVLCDVDDWRDLTIEDIKMFLEWRKAQTQTEVYSQYYGPHPLHLHQPPFLFKVITPQQAEELQAAGISTEGSNKWAHPNTIGSLASWAGPEVWMEDVDAYLLTLPVSQREALCLKMETDMSPEKKERLYRNADWLTEDGIFSPDIASDENDQPD